MALKLVALAPLLPTAIFDLRYATPSNICGKILYTDNPPRLQPEAAQQLAQAAEAFGEYAMKLVIWDAYRPDAVQKQLLSVNNDDKYVLDPAVSNHPQGLAVDLTLAYKDGELLDMATDFDEFTELAHVDADVPYEAQKNRRFLAETMAVYGFQQWPFEWWHFDFVGVGNG